MYLILNRTQVTDLGRLVPGVPYRFDLSVAAEKAVADRLLERGFASELTEEDYAKMVQDAAAPLEDGDAPTAAQVEKADAEAAAQAAAAEAKAADEATKPEDKPAASAKKAKG